VAGSAHLTQLEQLAEIGGKTIVDVGCGGGGFLLELACRGVHAIGVEIDDAVVQRARATVGSAAEIRLGRAEALPVGSGEADLVCFMMSLHHVPSSVHAGAIAEAARALKRGGRLHVVEPRPFGPLTTVLEPIEDERRVRTETHLFLTSLASNELRLAAECEYALARVFRDPEALIDHAVSVEPGRRARSREAEVRAEVTRRFWACARTSDAGPVLE
jgi:SAM-dependent methyltransferase